MAKLERPEQPGKIHNRGTPLMADSNDKEKWPSYTMVDPRMRKIYFQFYQETYKKSGLDRKTKELVAIAASLASHCKGCLEGHIKKALKYGATKEELSETIAITMGVGAASIVDLTDIAAENLQIRHFDATRAPEPTDVSPEE
jgi:AhpD family alkylhydroperoxidase